MIRTLNVGCGKATLKNTKDREYTNMDMLKLKDDNFVRHDLLKFPYPFEVESFDEIFMFHTIEHIPENWHGALAHEFRRLLKDGGKITFAYPEFLKVADNYKKNVGGKRDFWKATIYGRGLTEWDRHKALMDTPFFVELLHAYGLHYVRHRAEKDQPFNTILVVKKGPLGVTYEGIMEKLMMEGR